VVHVAAHRELPGAIAWRNERGAARRWYNLTALHLYSPFAPRHHRYPTPRCRRRHHQSERPARPPARYNDPDLRQAPAIDIRERQPRFGDLSGAASLASLDYGPVNCQQLSAIFHYLLLGDSLLDDQQFSPSKITELDQLPHLDWPKRHRIRLVDLSGRQGFFVIHHRSGDRQGQSGGDHWRRSDSEWTRSTGG